MAVIRLPAIQEMRQKKTCDSPSKVMRCYVVPTRAASLSGNDFLIILEISVLSETKTQFESLRVLEFLNHLPNRAKKWQLVSNLSDIR